MKHGDVGGLDQHRERKGKCALFYYYMNTLRECSVVLCCTAEGASNVFRATFAKISAHESMPHIVVEFAVLCGSPAASARAAGLERRRTEKGVT